MQVVFSYGRPVGRCMVDAYDGVEESTVGSRGAREEVIVGLSLSVDPLVEVPEREVTSLRVSCVGARIRLQSDCAE